jgi:hypothetical protein
MKYRKLRIAWSMAWGVMAILLVVQWSRNYWLVDLYVYWFAVLMSVGLARISWLDWSPRFSLRTMLFAITLVAAGMWLIMWAPH